MDTRSGPIAARDVAAIALCSLACHSVRTDTGTGFSTSVVDVTGHNLRIAAATLILFGVFLALQPISYALEIDGCLDRGGSFDYANHRCDFEVNHPAGSVLTQSIIYFGLALISFGSGLRLVRAASKRSRQQVDR